MISENNVEKEKSCSYKHLVFENKAYYGADKDEKALMSFNDSQTRLTSAGFDRHPLSAEEFSFICDYFDDLNNKTERFTAKQAKTVEDMLSGYDEWFCQAMEIRQDKGSKRTVIFYEIVTSLPRNKEDTAFDKAGMKYSGAVREFDITGYEASGNYWFRQNNAVIDGIVKYLTSRKFSDLPRQVKKHGKIFLPEQGILWPVCAGFVIRSYCLGASRGLRLVQKKA